MFRSNKNCTTEKKSKLSILLLRPVLDTYGVSKILFELAQRNKVSGNKVVLISSNGELLRNALNWDGIIHYQLPIANKNLLSYLKGIYWVLHILKKEDINIINSHHRWASFICFPVAKLTGIPLITTYHGIHEGKRLLSLWGNHVICVSKNARDNLIEKFKVKPSKITVIHNGIRLPDLPPYNLENKYCVLNNKLNIGYIARLSYEKDHETLLKAIKIVSEKKFDFLLYLVGSGPMENEIKKMVHEMNLNDYVRMLGQIDDVYNFISHMNFTVLSSITEGLPLSVLESMALEKPVIATDVGDINEVIIHNYNGLLVEKKKYQELAQSINQLIIYPELVRVMGKRARIRIEEKFGIRKMYEQVESIYCSQISKQKSSKK